jgi:uncharacterized circularly permuted ATP-grasp superfamily protein
MSLLQGYQLLPDTYDELLGSNSDGKRGPFMDNNFVERLNALSPDDFARAQALAERDLLHSGVTFSVVGDASGTEKIFPFCAMPRAIAADEFARLERGLIQRVAALQAFLADIYSAQKILADGIVPRELVLGATTYRAALHDVVPPNDVRIHIAGIDLIRDGAGTWRVLEDNVRTPSGVSYVLENREVTKRIFPRILDAAKVHRVDTYPAQLAAALRSVAPQRTHRDGSEPTIAVLTPGPFNSAYFEHTFLARTMGLLLVQAADLFVDHDCVFVRTTRGPQRIDVLYRRTDEEFLDPEVFRADSMLGVPGIMRAYRAGNLALANAPGNGIADDKAVYPFVPDMIRYYLNETPLLEQVPTYVCLRDDDRSYVLEHLDQLVVKAVDEAGGYGMLMGPSASKAELADFRQRIISNPRRYIAQHRVELSSCPTWDSETKSLVPRRVDLRPYIVTGRDGSWVLPGGLTRVALRQGSYVVNSSQGGGSKDTWVLTSSVAPTTSESGMKR